MEEIEFTTYDEVGEAKPANVQSFYASGWLETRTPMQIEIDNLKARINALEARTRKGINPFKRLCSKIKAQFECQREHFEDYDCDDY